MADQFFTKKDIIYTYTSKQAVQDGFLFDLDQMLNYRKLCPSRSQQAPLKYVTVGLLEKGYWNDRCKNGVPNPGKGHSDRCASCDIWIQHHGHKLSCLQPTLNIPNIMDLLSQAQRILNKRTPEDYFTSGTIELPDGKKQKIFIAQNETGRFTIMLPEEY